MKLSSSSRALSAGCPAHAVREAAESRQAAETAVTWFVLLRSASVRNLGAKCGQIVNISCIDHERIVSHPRLQPSKHNRFVSTYNGGPIYAPGSKHIGHYGRDPPPLASYYNQLS